jgi:hypothetical protein
LLVPAGDKDYEGVPYGDLEFDDVDWSEVGEHDPHRRSQRKGPGRRDVQTEWATEACHDPNRWVRSANSRSGRTVRVTGYSESAGFVVTVILAPKHHPLRGQWWGATAWAANPTDVRSYEEGK